MMPMGMNTIKRLENIDQLSRGALSMLDSICVHSLDRAFNITINDLIESIDRYGQSEESPNSELASHREKLFTYQSIFALDIERDLRRGLVAQMARTHVVDVWRIVLLQVCNDVQRIIITYLWGRKRKLGLYIQQLHQTFKHKNMLINENRSVVKCLGKLLAAKQCESIDDSGYEMVAPKSYNLLSYWFSG